jgi:AcrR family transcriptional regulator
MNLPTKPDQDQSRREVHRRENRDTLLAASRKVFAEIGYEAATVRDIVEASGLSRGTFYNYLRDKEPSFRAVAGEIVAEVRAAVAHARAGAPDADGFVAGAFAAMVGVMAQNEETRRFIVQNGPALRAVVGELSVTRAVTEDLQADLKMAVERGLLPPHRTDWLAVAMLGAAIEVVTSLRPDEDVHAAGEFLGNIFLHGLTGVAARHHGTTSPSSATTTSS